MPRNAQLAPLVERVAELEAVELALDHATGGHGRLVVIEGAAGTGRTALLDAAATSAASRGHQVLRASGRALERDFPLGVALQLFEPVAGKAAVDGIFDGAAALARPLLTPVTMPAAMPAGPILPSEDHAFSLIHGLYWLTANLAERSPLVLTVDDVHTVDRASLRFLLYLAERIEDVPVVLLLAGSPPAADGHCDDVVAQLRAQRRARHLELEALSAAGIAQLTRSHFFPDAEDTFCDAVFAATAGNPFLTVEYLTALDIDGVSPTAEGAALVGTITPASVKRDILARLRRLPPASGQLAAALAVLDGDADLETAAAVAGLPGVDAALALASLRRAELVLPDGPTRFTNAIAHTAIYDALTSEQRDALHAAAGRALARLGMPVERVAMHVMQSSPAGDHWALTVLWPAAARAAEAGQPASAVALLRRAVAEPPPADLLPDVLVDLGLAEIVTGDDTGFDRLQQAVTSIPNRVRRAEVLAEVGTALSQYGRYREAADVYQAAARVASDGPPQLLLRLEVGVLSLARVDPSLGSASLDRIERLAGSAGSAGSAGGRRSPERIAALALSSYYQAISGRALAQVRETALAAVDDPAAAPRLSILPAAAALAWVEDFERADSVATLVLDEARRRGEIMAVAQASYRRAAGRHAYGDISGALADAGQAIDAADHGGQVGVSAARGVAAMCLLEQGETGLAAAILGEGDGALDLSSGLSAGTTPYAVWLFARGRLRLFLGDNAGALDDFQGAGGILDRLGAHNPAFLPWRSRAAVAQARLGNREAATGLAEEELILARAFGAPRPLAAALRVKAFLADRSAAAGIFAEALSVARQSSAPLERAAVLVDAGGHLRRAGQRTRAVELLTEGQELAMHCGAVVLARRAEDEVRASGAKPRRGLTARGSAARLTPGEYRVAGLAASGLSNREIAQQLFVTVKAVEWHLGNTYAKLGVSSRSDLSGAIGDLSSPAGAEKVLASAD